MITQEQYQQMVQTALNRCFGMMTDPDKLYVLMQASIGDDIVAGGFIHTLLPRFKKKSAVCIVQERYRPFEIMFDGVSEIKYLNHIEFGYVLQFLHLKRQYSGDNWFWAYLRNGDDGKPVWSADTNMVDGYRQYIFDLPPVIPLFHPPIVKDIPQQTKQRFANDFILDKDRTVILAPMTSSGENLLKSGTT